MAMTTYHSLNVRRRTVGFQRHATVGIRALVVAATAKAGEGGVTADDLAGCWGGGRTGTPAKVGECMAILAGDKYGYAVERLSHPVSKGLDRYRFAAVEPATPAEPASPAPATPPPSDAPPADPAPAKGRKGRGRKGA